MLTGRGGAGVEVSGLIDSRPVSLLQKWIIVVCGLVVFLDGYDVQTMALAVPSVANEWHVSPSTFGLALSASLIGLMVGAGLIAPLGDRWGRRPLLMAGTALVGAASLCTAFSASAGDLVLWRLLTGVGLGICMPNATALTSEYMPLRRRAALVTLMFCNMALGAFVAGFTASAIIEKWDWRALFIVGGAPALLLCLLLWLTVPESVRFLLIRNPDDARVPDIIRRIAPGTDAVFVRREPIELKAASVFSLFTERLRAQTVLIWFAFALNLFVLYVLVSWMPTLLRGFGWAAASASRGVGTINAGGVLGGLLISWFVDRNRTLPAMMVTYVAVAVSLFLFTVLPDGAAWWLLLAIIGAGTSGAQMALNALTAATYPPFVRATGLGWATGVGRVGAALGPVTTAAAVGRHVPPDKILGFLVVPVLVGAVLVAWLSWRTNAASERETIGVGVKV